MCGPAVPRDTLPGSAMAAIFQTQSTLATVYFQNLTSGETLVRVKRSDDIGNDGLLDSRSSFFRIHRYGTPTTDLEENPAVHLFTIDGTKSVSSTGLNLCLTAGYEGVVGRGISIVDGKGRVLGSGIIGWN